MARIGSSLHREPVRRRRPNRPTLSRIYTDHGIVAFDNSVKARVRRGRSLIDRRSAAGKHAVAIRMELIADHGGTENLSIAKLALIELIARDVYFCDEVDARIFQAIYKANQITKAKGQIKNPKFVHLLYSYRAGVVQNLAKNLLALGLEKKPPPQKSLAEIIAESESENGVTK